MTKALGFALLANLFLTIVQDARADENVKLGSGKSVAVIAIGPTVSTYGWSALTLKYRTTIPLDQTIALREEADEIWDQFAINAEKGGYQAAVISANEPAQGSIVQSNQGWNFVFKKVDGSWRTLEAQSRTKLDGNFVKEFMARLDWAHDHNEMNALLLYMANDWTASLSDETRAGTKGQVLNRMQFVSVEHSALSEMTDHRHTREILSVKIGNNGTTAQVLSRETSQMTISGHKVGGVERSADIVQLAGNLVLWKRSESALIQRSGGN
jgi:hypothetical protein